jgi:hypothetical protein
MVLAPPATASEYFDAVGHWRIERDAERELCAMGARYEGPGEPQLTLVIYEDKAGLVVSNDDWTNRDAREVPIRITFDSEREYVPATARVLALDATFVGGAVGITMNEDALEEFRRSHSMQVYTGDKLIGKFGLDETSMAMLMTQACVKTFEIARIKRELAERPFADIDKDPFAPPPIVAGAKFINQSQVAGAVQNAIAQYVRTATWPGAKSLLSREFRTKVQLVVNANGEVAECEIERASVLPSLDKVVCDTIKRQGQFVAAVDAVGSSVIGTFNTTIVYTPLPRGG